MRCLDIRAVERTTDGVDILGRTNSGSGASRRRCPGGRDRAFAALACDTASVLEKHGIEVTVVDPRWVLPVPESIVATAADHRLVVTLEDGLVDGGVGAELIDALAAAGIGTLVMQRGFPGVHRRSDRGGSSPTWDYPAQGLSHTITENGVAKRIDDSSSSSVERPLPLTAPAEPWLESRAALRDGASQVRCVAIAAPPGLTVRRRRRRA